VFASSKGTPETGAIPICHSGNGKNFTVESPDASGVLNGHDKDDADIIPPFSAVDQAGVTTDYPGKNMDAIYGSGATGAEVLANGCEVPTGTPTETTAPITTQTPELLPGLVTAPPATGRI
jgi:hypothetical protein